MTNRLTQETSSMVATLDDIAKLANYSLMDTLNCDPDAKENGADHAPRQVFTDHYVPVKPTPIEDPEYIAHSKDFFRELGFADDISQVPEPMHKVGWSCGYALEGCRHAYIGGHRSKIFATLNTTKHVILKIQLEAP